MGCIRKCLGWAGVAGFRHGRSREFNCRGEKRRSHTTDNISGYAAALIETREPVLVYEFLDSHAGEFASVAGSS